MHGAVVLRTWVELWMWAAVICVIKVVVAGLVLPTMASALINIAAGLFN